MLKLHKLAIGILLAYGAVATAGCGETVYQVGTTPPPAPPPAPAAEEPPPPPPPPPPEAPKLAEVTDSEIKINDEIKFANNSHEIDPSSNKLIEAIANVMKNNPDVDFIEIAGHASKSGDANYNKVLTQKRSQAVLDAIAAKGVEKNRMRAAGYGFYCATGNEATDRRVAFVILRRNGVDTSQRGGGCQAADAKGLAAKPIPATAPKTKSK